MSVNNKRGDDELSSGIEAVVIPPSSQAVVVHLPTVDEIVGLAQPLIEQPSKRKSKRSGLSSSPYAKPKTLIHALAKQVQEYIHFPEPMPLFVTLGVLAANMMKGVPVWMMVVGPSSGGKTLAIEMLGDVERLKYCGKIQGAGALLSGTNRKDKAKDATGGILREFKIIHVVGCDERLGCGCLPRGMIVVKDFAEILANDPVALAEVVGALRGIADGVWSREIGSDGGRSMTWRGRVGFLGACTPKIDSKHGVIQELGQRWLYYRHDRTDGFGETQKSMNNRDREQMSKELKSLVAEYVQMQGLEWDGVESRQFTLSEVSRIYAMGSLMVAVRSQASRDWKTREVNDIDEPEAPMRMSTALGQLYLGLEAIGLDERYCWKVLGKVAMDSAPRLPVAVMRVIELGGVDGVVSSKVGELGQLPCSKGTVVRVIEDLRIFGLVEHVGERVRLSGFAMNAWKVGWVGVD